MKDLKKETAKLLAGASQNLAKGITSWSFEFWQRKDFRLYIKFAGLSQTEQDRIFNELEVSLLGLFVLHLENAVTQSSAPEQKIVFSGLQKDLSAGFIQLYIDLGLEKKFIDQWRLLIDMRLDEYRKDYKAALKESAKWQEFKKTERDLKLAWVRIETNTIDCLTHIRRGDVKKDDPLWKLLRKWFTSMDAQLVPMTSMSLS